MFDGLRGRKRGTRNYPGNLRQKFSVTVFPNRLFQPTCVIVVILINIALSLTFTSQAVAQTAEPVSRYECLDDLEKIIDGIDNSSAISFCADFHPGWTFRLHPNLGFNSILTDGSILRLLAFRPKGWLRGEPNTLEFGLVPYKPNLWSVTVRDGDTLYDKDSRRSYFLWARDTRTNIPYGPYGNKWTPAKVFRCFVNSGYGCVTYYDVQTCRKFKYQIWATSRLPIQAKISVSADTPETSEDLMENFHLAHDLVEEVLQRFLEHSCK